MQEILPGLYKTRSERPFWIFDRYQTSAYLLSREAGNTVVYSSRHLGADVAQWQALGGAKQQLLSHVHEASRRTERTRVNLGLRLYCSAADRPSVEKTCSVAGSFSEAKLGNDLEVIDLPGHTPGSAGFLWTSGTRRILFTGDSLYTDRADRWSVFIRRTNASQVIESLTKLRAVEADYVVPSGCYGATAVWAMTPEKWRDAIDRCIERIERGKTR